MPAHVARKRFGQHFLADSAVVDAIVRAIDPRPGDALVEIGPGLGALTLPLQERCGALTVVELDRDLAARLRRRAELNVIEADVLRVDFAALAAERGAALRIVGNLPYNISTPILFHLLDAAAHIRDQHFMLQKEVVDRMAAGPGGRDYGRLSVMLQWRYDIESLFDVPPEAFEPPPKVDFGGACGWRRGASRRRSTRRCSAPSSRRRFRNGESCCGTRSGDGWSSMRSRARSTSSAVPRKCRSPNTSSSPERSAAGNEKGGQAGRLHRKGRPSGRPLSIRHYAAFSHMAVSNALLINGMLAPKLEFAAFFDVPFAGLPSTLCCWAPSTARSHDPFSWERATEKNKNT